MKFAIAALALWASYAIATPADENAYDVRTADDDLLEIADMSWTGPVFPGGPEVTVHGTAKEIYEKLEELNPYYDAFDFPDLVQEYAEQGITKENFNETVGILETASSLEKRATISCKHGSWVGNWLNQCSEGYRYLKDLTNKYGRRCGADKYKCARVSCSTNCGMYYCNNNKDKSISAKCKDIAEDIKHIANSCPYGDSWPNRVRGRKTFSKHYVELSAVSC